MFFIIKAASLYSLYISTLLYDAVQKYIQLYDRFL